MSYESFRTKSPKFWESSEDSEVKFFHRKYVFHTLPEEDSKFWRYVGALLRMTYQWSMRSQTVRWSMSPIQTVVEEPISKHRRMALGPSSSRNILAVLILKIVNTKLIRTKREMMWWRHWQENDNRLFGSILKWNNGLKSCPCPLNYIMDLEFKRHRDIREYGFRYYAFY